MSALNDSGTSAPHYYPVVNDLIGGYDVSEWDKPVSEHDTRPEGGEYTIGTFMTEEWATRVADALNHIEEGETIWICEYPEFNDPACQFGISDPDPTKTRMPRKHSECGWRLVSPTNGRGAG